MPTANIGSKVGYYVMFGGLILMSMSGSPAFGQGIVLLGALLFSAVLLFQIVTLPVEFDASARAKRLAFEYGIVTGQERDGVATVLNAAALTYVAAAISTLHDAALLPAALGADWRPALDRPAASTAGRTRS